MTKSIIAILRWVELQTGVPSLGLATIRLWAADTISSKGTPFILGSNQITKIFLSGKYRNHPQLAPTMEIHAL